MAIEDLVKVNYGKLNENDFLIWNYINIHRLECSQCTIEELAKKCSVSRTTVLRFAKKLSMDGFSELKIHLKMEAAVIQKPTQDIARLVCNDYRKRIDEMEKNDYTEICRHLYEAKRIFVYGSGTVQSFVAAEFKRAFLSAQICMNQIEGGRGEQELILDILREGDLVIIVSLSGESAHVIDLAQKLKLKGIPFISMTKMKNNTLAQMSAESLYISTSKVSTPYIRNYETTTLYFMTVEMLLLKYLIYEEKRCDETIK